MAQETAKGDKMTIHYDAKKDKIKKGDPQECVICKDNTKAFYQEVIIHGKTETVCFECGRGRDLI